MDITFWKFIVVYKEAKKVIINTDPNYIIFTEIHQHLAYVPIKKYLKQE